MIYEYIEWNTDDLLADYFNQHKALIETMEAKTEYGSPFYLIFADNTRVKCSDTLSRLFRDLPNDSSDKKAFDIIIRGYEHLITGELGVLALPIFHDKTITCDEYVAPWRDSFGALYNFDGTILKQGANVQSYVVKDNTIQIEANAFCNCDNLELIKIGSYVDSIGECAFGNCPNLSTIIVSEYNRTYSSEGNTIIDKQTCTIICGCKNSTISNKVKAIGKSTFYGCKLLKSLVIPDSITVIESRAFSGCSSLERLSLPSSLKTVGEDVFSGCQSMKTLEINSKIDKISYKAFDNCRDLRAIYVKSETFDYYREIFSFTPTIRLLRKSFSVDNKLEFQIKHNIDDKTELGNILKKIELSGYIVSKNFPRSKWIHLVPVKLQSKINISPIDCETSVDEVLEMFASNCQIKVVEDKNKLSSLMSGAYFKRLPKCECGIVVYSNKEDILDDMIKQLEKKDFTNVHIVESNAQWTKIDFDAQSLWVKDFGNYYSFMPKVKYSVWGDRKNPAYASKKIEYELKVKVIKHQEGFDFSGDDPSRDPRLW
jgi:hypothetical protein